VRREIAAAALISIAILNGCKENRFIPRGRAEMVLSEIKLRGAQTVSRRIDNDEDFGRTVMDGVASGDSVWLDVAAAIQPVSATSEATLAIALASALPHSPRRVLSLLGGKYSAEEVCGIPFLKADSGEVIKYHDDATRAIASVPDSSVRAARSECVTALDSAQSRRLRRIDPGYVIKNKPAPAPRSRRR
jgi:hypothetical protein